MLSFVLFAPTLTFYEGRVGGGSLTSAKGGVCLHGGLNWGVCLQREVCLLGVGQTPPQSLLTGGGVAASGGRADPLPSDTWDSTTNGRYISYWNAFLSVIILT